MLRSHAYGISSNAISDKRLINSSVYHTIDLLIHPYDISVVYLCRMRKLISRLYKIAIMTMYIVVKPYEWLRKSSARKWRVYSLYIDVKLIGGGF